MAANPPNGSKITVSTEGGGTLITIPHQGSGMAQLGIVLFMGFWLCGWAYGLVSVGSEVWAGKNNLFTLFWLGGWTVGGLMAMYVLFQLLRPKVPETLRLSINGMTYDSGVAPMQLNNDTARQRSLSEYFPKRVRVDLTRQQLQSLRLRPTDSGNRLTVDAGAQRLDLAKGGSEIEREWLYQVLAKQYSVAPAPPE